MPTGTGTSSTKATAAATVSTSGGVSMPGCTRSAAAAFLKLVRIRSVTMARAMPVRDNSGP